MSNKKIIANIYIIVSFVFIAAMIFIYGGRFIYFYNKSHVKEEIGETLFVDVINNLSYSNKMIKEENNIYYSGNTLNNYVYYSNRYFRIIGKEDNNLVLVDDGISTILSYNEDFSSSDINKWLNPNEEENTGIYYNSLNEPSKYLTTTKTCLDIYDSDGITCNNYIETNVGMLSLNQYFKASINGNYLNISKNYLFSNKDGNNNNWYINSKNELGIANSNPLYGIRAVITLKDDVLYYGGSGTYYDPYFISEEDALAFGQIENKGIKIGSYIIYSDSIWRVIDKTDDYYKLALNESIGEYEFSQDSIKFSLKDKKSLAYYLNNDYYDTLDNKLMKSSKFYIGSYENSYLDKYENEIEAYVGLLEIGDLFIDDVENTYTLTNTGIKNTIFKVVDGKLYSDRYSSENDVRPVIFLDSNIKILQGFGTLESPYEVGEA